MPELFQGGAMTIVAHQDDDILFMNPDIYSSIDLGETNTTVYVTAGDAGRGEAYYLGREDGMRAAYSEMTGSTNWVTENIVVPLETGSVTITSSVLEDMPEVRLYFLRLPDGGGIQPVSLKLQLERLEDGRLSEITAIDGSETYTRDELLEALSGLMTLHMPEEIRLQTNNDPYEDNEHTDHVATTNLVEDAIGLFDGGIVTVTEYVSYDSRNMPINLSAEDQARSLAVMEAYAEHDSQVTNSNGDLGSTLVSWTARQYVAEQYEVDTGEPDDPGPDDPEPWPGAGEWSFSLSGEDAFLFDISTSGAVTPKDWFRPSLDDAWDANEDYTYEVTITALSAMDGSTTTLDIRFETTAEGVLTPDIEGPADPDDPVDPDNPDGPDDPPPPVADAVYTLAGDDAQLFLIDAETGAITPQDWFSPSLGDAWDRNEDYIYELIRVATSPDGSVTTEETIRFDTVAEGVLEQIVEGESLMAALSLPDDAEPEPGGEGTLADFEPEIEAV